ncbi:MAG: DnaJ domain-containing protein [Paracoccaceae bacterium]
MHPLLAAGTVAIGVALAFWLLLVVAPKVSPEIFRRTLGLMLIAGGAGMILLRLYVPAIIMAIAGLGLVLRPEAGVHPARRGRASTVRTRYLAMALDHASGRVDGEILAGPYSGRKLSELGLSELLRFGTSIRDDPESVKLLEAYLDSTHPEWRGGEDRDTGAGRESASASGAMSRDEALRVLGLEPGADDEEIREAHHRLIKRVHPDRGGSAELAARINEARDRLLGG